MRLLPPPSRRWALIRCKCHERHFHHRKLPLAERPGGRAVSRLCPGTADRRFSLPSAAVADCRRPPLRQPGEIWLAATITSGGRCGRRAWPERYCTGDASDREKFHKWAETVPQTLRNPLYHWTHLELNRPLGISDRLLGPATAEGIWQECNAKLARPEFSVRGILRQMNVACFARPTIRPTVEHHRAMAADKSFPLQCCRRSARTRLGGRSPASSTPGSTALQQPAASKLATISTAFSTPCGSGTISSTPPAAGFPITAWNVFRRRATTAAEVARPSFGASARAGRWSRGGRQVQIGPALRVGPLDHEKGWMQQFHLGACGTTTRGYFKHLVPTPAATRSATRRRPADGPVPRSAGSRRPAGQDDPLQSQSRRQRSGGHDVRQLPGRRTPGKMQCGARGGSSIRRTAIERQLDALSNQGLAEPFVGMVTDSRSFLSLPGTSTTAAFSAICWDGYGQGLLPDDVR